MAGLDHVGATHTDRGPCSTLIDWGPTGQPTYCSHDERNHDHLRSSGSEHCGTCGSLRCPRYRPPRGQPCVRCGVRETAHADLNPDVSVIVGTQICPRWVRPAPLWMRALTRLLSWPGRGRP
jgi:hypothetical protein